MDRVVLVIDDDLDTVTFISMILEQEGYKVLATTDVEEGLIYFETQKPAVLVLDLEMPAIHGVQVLKKIQPGIEKDFSVIILTGYGHDANIKICYELGAYAFLSKPVHIVELKGLVRNAFLWEEYKKALNEQHVQLEELVQQRTLKLSHEIQLRKQTEQQLLNANQLKDKILSILTLDLRAPLSNVIMGLRYIQENIDKLDKNALIEHLWETSQEAQNTWQLTENIFLWARCQKGEIVNRPERYNLSAIINDTLLYFSNMIKNKGITVTTNVPETLEIYADRNLVYAIIQNIISNALKFSLMNGVVSITASTVGETNLICKIIDNGIGISEEQLPYIMDITKPISIPGTANEKGSGFGLIICQELCKVIGAEMSLESKLGVGTSVTIKFPTINKVD